jgi:hypothetical protein
MGGWTEEGVPWKKEGGTCYAKGNGGWHEERPCANTEFTAGAQKPREDRPRRGMDTPLPRLFVLGPPTDTIYRAPW